MTAPGTAVPAIRARAQRAVRHGGGLATLMGMRQAAPTEVMKRFCQERRYSSRLTKATPGDQTTCYHAVGIKEELMEGLWVGILGTAGTVLSTVSLMPQVIRTWRTRSAADISATWLVVALVAMVIWVAYGSLINAPAVVLVNVLCFFQSAYILFIKLQSSSASVVVRH